MTSKANKLRQLHFETFDDILADVQTLQDASDIKLGGQWTAAQNIDHIRRFMTMSREGTTVKAPLWLRILGRLLRGGIGKRDIPSGFKIPPAFEAQFVPPADISMEQAVANLRSEIELAKVPGAMNQASPLFGKLSYEKWYALHLRHAELHLGHVAPA